MTDIKKGKFLVFEGIDGCGKGTQIQKATDFLYHYGYKEHDVYLTREPTIHARNIRNKLLKNKEVMKDAEWFAEMYTEDRRQHVENFIKPMLENGVEVLNDRYKYSTIVFQHVQGIPTNKLVKMHEGLPSPDLTIIFDCPADIAFNRKHSNGCNTEVFDKDLEFQKKCRQGYLKMPDLFQDENIIILDSSRTIDEIFEDVKEEIVGILK